MKISAIDIGTNTLLMVIGSKEADSPAITLLYDAHSIARLGEGVDKTGLISEEAEARAASILAEYKAECERLGVTYIAAAATSAVRDAKNGTEVCKRLAGIIGFPIHTISGDEEARLSFLGTAESPQTTTVIDIGGGSTEYVTGENNMIQYRMSLQIGAVRLHERFLHSLPPSQSSINAARNEIRQQLSLLPQGKVLKAGNGNFGELVGVGGTFTTLAAIDLKLEEFDSAKVHRHNLSINAVSGITEYLLSHSLTELLRNPAIHPKRADILPAGALILEETLAFFGTKSAKASTKGLRYGILYDAFERVTRDT